MRRVQGSLQQLQQGSLFRWLRVGAACAGGDGAGQGDEKNATALSQASTDDKQLQQLQHLQSAPLALSHASTDDRCLARKGAVIYNSSGSGGGDRGNQTGEKEGRKRGAKMARDKPAVQVVMQRGRQRRLMRWKQTRRTRHDVGGPVVATAHGRKRVSFPGGKQRGVCEHVTRTYVLGS